MPGFFKRLNFTFGNEDWETEQTALNLKSTDRVLCVTGSGDRPLHLLMQDCNEIIAVDANPSQTHLLELKMAAMRSLPYDDYIAFLGGEHSHQRLSHFAKIAENLPEEAKQFWKKNHKMLSKGILYEGKVEKRMQLLSKLVNFFQGKKRVRKLFEFDNLTDQRHYVQNHWDRFLWRKILDIGLQPKLSKLLWKDPGLYAHVDDSIKPGRHIHERMQVSLKNHLARDNFFMSFWLKGHVEKNAYPPYLTSEGVALIQPRVNRIKAVTSDLIGYIESAPPNSFDCFSLSDVISYIDAKNFDRLMQGVVRTARPGARFCIREFLSRRDVPQALQKHFQRDHALENKLEESDRCFLYKFMVGNIKK